MKKILATLIGLILLIPYASAYYEYTKRFEILSFHEWYNNLTIEYEGDMLLLHYKGSCDDVGNDNMALFAIRDNLNSNGDYLVLSSTRKCLIDQAEEFDEELYLDQVHANNYAIATDKNGVSYDLYYDDRCPSIARYWKGNVYLKKYGATIKKSDRIYLPNNDGYCSITYVKERAGSTATVKPEGDVTVPSTVSGVTATPADGAVYLSWDKASDNTGIDHYVVSYSTYNIDPDKYSYTQMPNKAEVDGTSYKIEDLDNNDIYYFFVMAVDGSGNMSSDWSSSVHATPNSSIRTTNTSEINTDVNLRITQESAYSFLIEWDRISDYDRQSVIFKIDGNNDFVYYDWYKNYMRISKKDYRKGKNLELTVKEYDTHSGMFEDSVEFDF